MERQKIWTEDLGGAHLSGDDMLSNLGFEDMHNVVESPGRHGVIMVGNCRRCGRQWKMAISWGEVQCFFIGQKVRGAVPTAQGVVIKYGCPACRKVTPVLCRWPEIRGYVDHGVSSGCLSRDIYNFANAG
jgi:hypothetical protein